MTIESIFRSRLAPMALALLALAVGGVDHRVCGGEPIVLRQPTATATSSGPIALRQPQTTLVVLAAVNEEPVAAADQPATVAAPAPMQAKRRAAQGAPFTPHYLCLCPPYCQKPMPCVDCCYKCCPDCYCPKPMPCPNPCYNCVCDDYCAKPMPCRFPQPLCGPRAPCRQSEPCPIYAPFPPRGPCVGP